MDPVSTAASTTSPGIWTTATSSATSSWVTLSLATTTPVTVFVPYPSIRTMTECVPDGTDRRRKPPSMLETVAAASYSVATYAPAIGLALAPSTMRPATRPLCAAAKAGVTMHSRHRHQPAQGPRSGGKLVLRQPLSVSLSSPSAIRWYPLVRCAGIGATRSTGVTSGTQVTATSEVQSRCGNRHWGSPVSFPRSTEGTRPAKALAPGTRTEPLFSRLPVPDCGRAHDLHRHRPRGHPILPSSARAGVARPRTAPYGLCIVWREHRERAALPVSMGVEKVRVLDIENVRARTLPRGGSVATEVGQRGGVAAFHNSPSVQPAFLTQAGCRPGKAGLGCDRGGGQCRRARRKPRRPVFGAADEETGGLKKP